MVAQYQEMTTSMEAQVNEIRSQIDVLKQKLEEEGVKLYKIKSYENVIKSFHNFFIS